VYLLKDDGDISSAPAPSRRSPHAHGRDHGHHHPHEPSIYSPGREGRSRAPIVAGSVSQSTALLSRESSPSPPCLSTSVADSSSSSIAHAPAPLEFLSRLTPEEMQAKIWEAIQGGAGPDGRPRSYKINRPPTGRPVRIYADGKVSPFTITKARRRAEHGSSQESLIFSISVMRWPCVKQSFSFPQSISSSE
jgi:choline-phosphate cytidylyltransferase